MKLTKVLFFAFLLVVLGCNAFNSSTSSEQPDEGSVPPLYVPVTFNEFGWAVIESFPDTLIHRHLRIIEAADARVAWVSDWAENVIYKTENGGASWRLLSPPRGDFYTFEAIDSLNLWVGTEQGVILKSSDGGDTWAVQFENPGITNFINYIEFFDLMNGVAMGDSPPDENTPFAILHTDDGGQTWVNANTTLKGSTSHYAVNFSDANSGLLRLSDNNLYWTSDGGASWDALNPDPDYITWTLVALEPATAIVSFVEHESRTTNRGQTWDPLPAPVTIYPSRYTKIRQHPGHVWAVQYVWDVPDGGDLVTSTDYGVTWKLVETGFEVDLDVVAPSSRVVWATGRDGVITYTTKADSLNSH